MDVRVFDIRRMGGSTKPRARCESGRHLKNSRTTSLGTASESRHCKHVVFIYVHFTTCLAILPGQLFDCFLANCAFFVYFSFF